MFSRKIINIYNNLARKHGNATVKDFWKYEKLEYKQNRLKLDIDFLNTWKRFDVYPKFLIFKLSNVLNKDSSSIRKRLHCSAISHRNKELQHVWKELGISKNFISKQLSTIDFYILKKSVTSHNRNSLQKSLYTQHKKISSLTTGCSYLYSQLTKLLLSCSLPIFTANETTTNLTQYELSQEETDLLGTNL